MTNKKKNDRYEMAEYLFHKGENFKAHLLLGSFLNGDSCTFRVWAPNAARVYVTGDFNDWNYREYEMNPINENGLYELEVEGVKEYDCYKYVIITEDDRELLKSDPYARHFETRPNTASKVYKGEGYKWKDKKWMSNRSIPYTQPMNIYELNLGSWRKYDTGEYFDYRKLADEVVPYLKSMAYTHVELMPVMEHPYDKSWGYQVTGYFAPTSRYGTPDDFKYFIDKCHRNNISVILDWVPAHFPKDEQGLYEFDGKCLYEYSDPLKMEHKEWGTRVFDYGRNEVRSFLMSSAAYWLEEFHVDGLRVDAVSSMLYLDYCRQEYRPNIHGDNGNLEAIEFLKKLNLYIREHYEGVMMIAEESTDWPKVTADLKYDGLGFTFKWNMGWMNDSLSYLCEDPLFRIHKHDKITFPLTYCYAENYILPISHDEVVHGKKSMVDKAPVSYEDKFRNLKTFMGYMFAHPGKKLTFMGTEFGQFIEWNEEIELDWFLLDYYTHRHQLEFSKELNKFYRKYSPLWANDYDWNGFRWHVVDDAQNNVYAFSRINDDDEILVVLNFSGQHLENYRVGVPYHCKYKQVFSSDEIKFGGMGNKNLRIKSKKGECTGFDYYIELTLPPFTAQFFEKKPDAVSNKMSKPEKKLDTQVNKKSEPKTEIENKMAKKKRIAEKTASAEKTKSAKKLASTKKKASAEKSESKKISNDKGTGDSSLEDNKQEKKKRVVNL